MDIDLLSKMVKELILDRDEVTLPGVGTFVAETVPASFSDKGYTINPPYRRLSFRQRQNEEDTALLDLYIKSNEGVDPEQARRFVTDFLLEMKEVLKAKKNIVFPGLGRLRSTKENNFFFVADEDLDIYPGGFGLESISLKTHQETSEEVSDVIQKLRGAMEEPFTVTPSVVEGSQPDGDFSTTATPPVEMTETGCPIESGITEEMLGMTEEDSGMTEETSGMTEETLGMTEEASGEVGEPHTKKTIPGWLTAILWVAGTIAAIIALYILASHMFPDFFDSILYTKEELEILNY